MKDIQLIELMLDKAHIDYIEELIDSETDTDTLAWLMDYRDRRKMEFREKLKEFQTA